MTTFQIDQCSNQTIMQDFERRALFLAGLSVAGLSLALFGLHRHRASLVRRINRQIRSSRSVGKL